MSGDVLQPSVDDLAALAAARKGPLFPGLKSVAFRSLCSYQPTFRPLDYILSPSITSLEIRIVIREHMPALFASLSLILARVPVLQSLTIGLPYDPEDLPLSFPSLASHKTLREVKLAISNSVLTFEHYHDKIGRAHV